MIKTTVNPKTKQFIKKRKLIDRAFRLISDLKGLTEPVPVYYQLIELNNVTSPVIAVSDLIEYYFNNSDHNELTMISAATDHRQWYLVATIGKSLDKFDKLSHFLKLEIGKFVKVQSTPLPDQDYLSGAINDMIAATDHQDVKHGMADFNDQITIAYSKSISQDRDDYNYNIDDDYNHGCLLGIEHQIMHHKY